MCRERERSAAPVPLAVTRRSPRADLAPLSVISTIVRTSINYCKYHAISQVYFEKCRTRRTETSTMFWT